ncbi:hypothetical protein [Bacillus sp. REN16]|uniref:hypothetical protein n=1 Tax=Bacillus sp. REN16 TaxID=2887296 RepID=UPI001E4AC89B|nr:hypothetical protein [Bacillus sp. REN16]MCC3355710.1 hypothetical protein [Bacillus sp. REN16]
MSIKKRSMFILVCILLLLTGCRSTPFGGHSIIDWVDFIKMDGKEYNGIHSGVLADEQFVGEKIGSVKFKVADNVTNPSYKIRDGDAAFHEKGTEIFKIKDQPHLIAVKDTHSINGYRVYYSKDDIEYQWHFKNMPIEKVKRIEIYQVYTPLGNKQVSKLTKNAEVKSFLQLLENSKTDPNFQPDTEKGDPIYYEMIFYTDEPIAYKYNMQFDGSVYFWHPWDTAILPDGIKMFMGK